MQALEIEYGFICEISKLKSLLPSVKFWMALFPIQYLSLETFTKYFSRLLLSLWKVYIYIYIYTHTINWVCPFYSITLLPIYECLFIYCIVFWTMFLFYSRLPCLLTIATHFLGSLSLSLFLPFLVTSRRSLFCRTNYNIWLSSYSQLEYLKC